MKVSVAVIIILSTILLYSSRGFSQQAGGSPQPASPSGGKASQPFLSQQRGARITIIGSPPSQPSRGLGIECTPVEQGIAGLIIGPTDLVLRRVTMISCTILLLLPIAPQIAAAPLASLARPATSSLELA